jgi:hypothetical protein
VPGHGNHETLSGQRSASKFAAGGGGGLRQCVRRHQRADYRILLEIRVLVNLFEVPKLNLTVSAAGWLPRCMGYMSDGMRVAWVPQDMGAR